MASTMDSSLGGMLAPQQSALNDLQSGSSGFFQGANDGMKTAIGLATASDQIEQKKAQTEQMRDQLDQMKFNKLTTGINAVTRADPKYRQAIADQVYKGFDRNGIAVDPVWREALVKDDSTRTQMMQALPILMNRSSDPNARAQAFQTMAQYMDPTGLGDGHDKLTEFIQSENKNQVAEKDAQTRADATVEAAKERAAAMKGPGSVSDTRTQRLEQKVHGDALKDINNDKDINTLRTSYQNLILAKKNFLEGGQSPNEFEELQQAVRANLGLKGTSGVDERDATKVKSVGLNLGKLTQFLTGNNQNVGDYDQPFIDQIMKLVDLEKSNKEQQASSMLDQKASGHQASFYDDPAHEKYRKDFNATLAKRYKQFNLPVPGQEQSAPQAPASVPAGQQTPVAAGQPAAPPAMSSYDQFKANVLAIHPETPEAAIKAKFNQRTKGK